MYLIGKTTTTHGIKGELKVVNLSDFDRFQVGDIVYIDDKPYEIQSSRVHKNKVLVSFKNLNSINDVLYLKNKDIYSVEKITPEDGYHYEDLIGQQVFDESKSLIGVVNSIREVPQGHILEVLHQQKKVLIPFVDAFIKDVSDDGIIVRVIEGLL